MTGVERAAAAATEWLLARDAPEAAIAAHEQGVAESDADARRWVRYLLDGERDGAWDDDLLATVTALLRLWELRQAAALKEQDPAIGRALGWVRGRRGLPGAWTDVCTPDRHRHGFCRHFMGGFLSPAQPEREIAEIELPSGAQATGDDEARLVISAVALRCLMHWQGVGTDARLHLEGLRRVVDRWGEPPVAGLTTTALLAVIHALVGSSRGEDREAAARAIQVVAGKQRADGSWVDADPFHALAVLDAAADAGIAAERVGRALDHGARLLVATQHADGSWGSEHGPGRALIALRALARMAGQSGRER